MTTSVKDSQGTIVHVGDTVAYATTHFREVVLEVVEVVAINASGTIAAKFKNGEVGIVGCINERGIVIPPTFEKR